MILYNFHRKDCVKIERILRNITFDGQSERPLNAWGWDSLSFEDSSTYFSGSAVWWFRVCALFKKPVSNDWWACSVLKRIPCFFAVTRLCFPHFSFFSWCCEVQPSRFYLFHFILFVTTNEPLLIWWAKTTFFSWKSTFALLRSLIF